MNTPVCLGLDTSNYTTSLAVFDGTTGCNVGRLLDVPAGALGLRQSDALFQHVKHLPELFARMRADGLLSHITCVGASTKPRWVEGSYMPCFLAGESQAQAVADTLGVPFFACAHQQGHVAAAAWSAGRMDLLERPHLAWHLSGGTTELLLVTPVGRTVMAVCIGGTSDISAGQLIDRTGKRLGLRFPAGKALDALAATCDKEICFPIKTKDLVFSLSGMENQVDKLLGQGETPGNVAGFVLRALASVLSRTGAQAQARYPGLPLLCSGGVASNSLLRAALSSSCGAIFAAPQYATDNALGVAILAQRSLNGGTQ